MKNEIIPVILAKNFADFKRKFAVIKSLRPKPRWIQIDVVQFSVAEQRKIRCSATEHIEIDLMAADPIGQAKKWIKAGAKRILIHVGVIEKSPLLFKEGLGVVEKGANIEVGLSLNAATPISHLTPYIKYADCVLLRGGNIGKSGQQFQPQVLKKIRALRKKYPTLPIEVDGGVNLSNAQAILSAGATRLATASAILSSPDPQKSWTKFLSICRT